MWAKTLKTAFPSIIILLSLLCYSTNTFAQEKSEDPKKLAKKAKKYVNWAKEFIRVEEYHFAADLLREGLALVPDNEELHYHMGIVYLHSVRENKKNALPHLQKARKSKEPFEKIDYYMGRSFHFSHLLDSALHYYETYLKQIPEDNLDERVKVTRMMHQCRVGQLLMRDSLDVEIFNLGNSINTDRPEIAPVISADEQLLIFTSRRDDSMGEEMDPLYDLPHEDIYVAEKGEDGQWLPPHNIGSHINTAEHDAAIGVSPDARMLFIYKSDENDHSELAGDIYVSYFENGKWGVPKRLPEPINTHHWETHATITADGKSMYFTSNRPTADAQGGKDIYVIRKLPDGSWAAPQNLGAHINTSFDEESPFIHPDGNVLYFSSEGHESMGGYDIFYTEWDEEKQRWSAVKNIGYPINTAFDDIFFSVSADGSRGYFSSIRDNSYGGHDIYMVNIPQSKSTELIVMRGKVTDYITGKPVEASIEVFEKVTNKEVIRINSNANNGYYSLFLKPGFDYGVRIIKDGYLFKSYYLKGQDYKHYLEVEENFALKPLGEFEHEVLQNVFFTEYNDLMVSSEPELNAMASFIKSLDDYIVEIAIHAAPESATDSLVMKFETQARADALIKELERFESFGEEDLIGKGYGLGGDFPLADNNTRLGRARNTRVEYILRKKLPNLTDLDYNTVLLRDRNEDELLGEIPVPIPGQEIKIPYAITFETASNSLGVESQKAIDLIVRMMDRYPEIMVEVGGHTDSVGSADYNLILGRRRARMIAQQIEFKGIENARIKVASYGESKPIESNATPEGRKKNRRITFKALETPFSEAKAQEQ
ncbi:OmpA family protein [Limibacter armeniacum]|uniref:OmpA family protein n=1 Tax=Limibacter armeniacum TaxID=466084 RepID=UPI002FE5B364